MVLPTRHQTCLCWGREIEVPLDVTSESTPDAEPSSTESCNWFYNRDWLVHTRRCGDTQQRRPNASSETMASGIHQAFSGWRHIGYTIFVGRKAGIPS